MNSSRYSRIIRLADMGAEKFERLSRARVVLVGCGTLGGAFALNLVRMGVGSLRLIDRDIVEEHNLSTQWLFDEADVRESSPKAVAARRHLEAINSSCRIEAHASDLTFSNAEAHLQGSDLILDGTDNFDTRYLINDAAIKLGIPWIYCGVVGYSGVTLAILPGKSACLRCLMKEPPNPSGLPTCETAGVWPASAQAIAAVALSDAVRILLGQPTEGTLSELDLQTSQWRKVKVARRQDCPACAKGQWPYLSGEVGAQAIKMCGREMVHLSAPREEPLDLAAMAKNLRDVGQIKLTEHLLHLRIAEGEIYLFADGRALIKGVGDTGRARAIFNRYVPT
jgi:adenylyltransferase/sulfurtransferase